jgi:SAM-dependent methyltransferase
MDVLFSTNRFETTLEGIDQSLIQNEVAFVCRQLPQPRFKRLLQLHCGDGLHSLELSKRGYYILGTSQTGFSINAARAAAHPNLHFIVEDMRTLAHPPASFDSVLFLWQSFGFFSERSNRDILRQIRTLLQPGGRLILDLYQPSFFERHIGIRQYLVGDTMVTEKKSMRGGRLNVVISYDGKREPKVFDWRLYSPFEIIELAELYGFHVLHTCTNFEENTSPSKNHPRVQYVLEKPRLMM